MSSSAPSSQNAPPSISAVYDADARPAISVVIPTFEPGAFLIETLQSVLEQDMGDLQMQIVIVDDGSKRTDLNELLMGIAHAGRVEIRVHPDTLGLAGNWNRAIGYARGEFIHILHQDDIVAPSFYRTLLEGLRSSPRIAMGFCRHAFIDEKGRTERISHRERWRAGVLNNWLERISERQRLQCPAAIVRREAYESLGGFRPDLRYALDWEMWVRIAAQYDVWYEPRVLASYRRHGATETSRLEAAGATSADTLAAIAAFSVCLPDRIRARMQSRAYSNMVLTHTRRALKLAHHSPRLAMNHVEAAQTAIAFLPLNLKMRWAQSRLARATRTLEASIHTAAESRTGKASHE